MKTRDQNMVKKISPLYPVQQKMGAVFVEEKGWTFPLHFGSPEKERDAAHHRVAVGDLSAFGKIVLRGHRVEDLLKDLFPDIPRKIGWVVDINDASPGNIYPIRLGRLAPDEYFLLTPVGEEKELIRSLDAAGEGWEKVSWVDLTPGQAGLAVIGPYARDTMRKLTALPLSSSALPKRQIVQTGFGKTHGILLRYDRGDIPGFEVFADRSYGEYLWEAVLDAGQEWDIEPVGWEVLSALSSG